MTAPRGCSLPALLLHAALTALAAPAQAADQAAQPRRRLLDRKLVREATDRAEHLVPLLYVPRLPIRWAEDGTLLLQAPTQKECQLKLDFALKLIHEARYQAQ